MIHELVAVRRRWLEAECVNRGLIFKQLPGKPWVGQYWLTITNRKSPTS